MPIRVQIPAPSAKLKHLISKALAGRRLCFASVIQFLLHLPDYASCFPPGRIPISPRKTSQHVAWSISDAYGLVDFTIAKALHRPNGPTQHDSQCTPSTGKASKTTNSKSLDFFHHWCNGVGLIRVSQLAMIGRANRNSPVATLANPQRSETATIRESNGARK